MATNDDYIQLLAQSPVPQDASQLAVILDAIPVLVSFVTREERYGFVNAAYEAWFGVPREQLIGRTLREVVGESAYAKLAPFVRRGLSGETFSFEQHGVPYRLGGTRDIKVSFVPHRDPDGAIGGYVAMLEDITAATQLAAARSLAEDRLAEQAVEQRRLLSEAREATLAADEANRAKDEFLATASHELRTPLNAILGWTQLLRLGHLKPDAAARATATIERNARAQIRLIEDILDGSRVLTGNLRLEVRPVDLDHLVRAALDSVRSAAEAKQLDVSIRLEADATRVSGDGERLQQVVWNLVNNAIKFTPKGGSVTVTLRREGASIELAVADTGQGIRAEFLPHVFERFRQAEGGATRRHGGLGLGLALVRHLMEAHGGSVSAESEGEGRGARFVARLPVRAVYEPQADSDRAPPMHHDIASLDPPTLRGALILVVDDEPDSRELVAAALEASGALVSTAASAEGALSCIQRHVPHLIISDVGMPEVDGYEFMRRLRGLRDERSKVPAIALTAYSRERDRRSAIAAGFQAYAMKPIEPVELARIAAVVLARHANRAHESP